MSRTANLRRQHEAAVDLVQEIIDKSARIDTPDEGYRLSVLLAKLTGLLRIHFVQEDRTLYPYMIECSNAAASETAQTFLTEMGGLSDVFDRYSQRWTASGAIFGDPDGFRQQSKLVFDALARRIERENDILYPLADAIAPHEVRRTA